MKSSVLTLIGTGDNTAVVAAAMSEADLERGVRKILDSLPQLLAYHTHDSRRSPSGFPDWVIIGPRAVIYRELKRQDGKLTGPQLDWITALIDAGQNAGVWRPADLLSGGIARQLAALAGLPVRQVT